MHEAGLAEDLIRSIEERLKAAGECARIKSVYVRLGRSAHASEASLRFWFENLRSNTRLKDAELKVSLVEGKEITVDSLEAE